MKNLTKETWKMISTNGASVLLFELLYRGITAPVYLRFADRGIRLALRMTGDSYLTAGNIGKFLLHPGTLAVLMGLGAVGVLLMLFETAGLVTAFQGSAYDQKLTPFSIFTGALHKLRGMSRSIWYLAVPTLAGAMWINLGLLAWVFNHVRPVNFVLKEISGSPAWTLAVAGILLVALALILPLAFLHFGCLEGRYSFRESLTRSRRLMGVHGQWVLVSLAAALLASIAWTVVMYLAAVFVAAVFVMLFVERRLAMAVLLLTADRIERIVLLAGSITATVISLGILAVFYFRYGKLEEGSGRDSHGAAYDQLQKHRKNQKRVVWVSCTVLLIIFVYLLDLVQNRFDISGDLIKITRITAHRGGSRIAPENTLAALRAAEEELADYAEIDVQITADGVVVLGHDTSLKRVAGINQAIGALDWAELSLLDVGSWFSPEYAGERIPTLEEVLEFCFGRLRLNIEIKNVGPDSPIPELVAELVRAYGYEEQCVITSTSLGYLVRVKQAAPELKTGYVIAAAYGDFYSLEEVDFISIRHSFVTQALVDKLHSQGKEIHVWTVNRRNDMERLRLLDVDNLITDDPVLAREILYQEEAAQSLMEYLRMIFE